MEQYEEGHCEVCGVVPHLSIGESKASKTHRNVLTTTYVKWKRDEIAMNFVACLPRAQFERMSYR